MGERVLLSCDLSQERDFSVVVPWRLPALGPGLHPTVGDPEVPRPQIEQLDEVPHILVPQPVFDDQFGLRAVAAADAADDAVAGRCLELEPLAGAKGFHGASVHGVGLARENGGQTP